MTKLTITPVKNETLPNTNSNKTSKKKEYFYGFLKYSASAGTGAAIGYSIKVPDKDIIVKKAQQNVDGPDIISGDRHGLMQKIKTKINIPEVRIKVRDTAKKFRNALIGAFVGIGLVGLYNILKPEKEKE